MDEKEKKRKKKPTAPCDSNDFHLRRKHVFTQIPVGPFLCLNKKAFLKVTGNRRARFLSKNFLLVKAGDTLVVGMPYHGLTILETALAG